MVLKMTINWDKYQSKILAEAKSKYLDFSINHSFKE